MAFNQQFKTPHAWLLVIVISLAVFFESSIPYLFAVKSTPAGSHFLGQLTYLADQDMYFSFISQARDGHFMLNNRLTAIPNKPVFINLEFWLVGFIQRITGISVNVVYHVWRYMGALLLTIGMLLMASVVLTGRRRVLLATCLVLFTGGFGFIFALLSGMHLVGFNATQMGIIDMRYGMVPFQQMVTNPHFAFPHGLILIAYAFFLLGERTGSLRHYICSGIFFNIIGLVRPYDIIAPVVIFPVFILVTNWPFTLSMRMLTRKLLPLFMIIPVFIYNVWLFKFNDIFKFWSQQGLNAGIGPSPVWQYLAYGISGILAIVRVAQVGANPLGKYGRFLLVWFGVTFVFIHLGRFIPAIGWSPQIGVYLVVPLALLGCSARLGGPVHSRARYYSSVAVVAGCVAISNLSIVFYFVKNFRDSHKMALCYVSQDYADAWAWLRANTHEGDVVLAGTVSSLRIPKYTSASVVMAHYSVTPHFDELQDEVSKLFTLPRIGEGQKAAIVGLGADYLYVSPFESMLRGMQVDNVPYLSKVYSNASIAIYRVRKDL